MTDREKLVELIYRVMVCRTNPSKRLVHEQSEFLADHLLANGVTFATDTNVGSKIETNLYDIEEVHHNCTVQILRNSVTGEQSIGWWPETQPPMEF